MNPAVLHRFCKLSNIVSRKVFVQSVEHQSVVSAIHRVCRQHYATDPTHVTSQVDVTTSSENEKQQEKAEVTPAKDFRYFKALTEYATVSENNQSNSELQKALETIQQSVEDIPSEEANLDLYKGIDAETVKPAIQKESFNLAAYVSKSDTLSNLVKLGVDLSAVEKHRSDANHLLKLDFRKDVEPYLFFFHDLGVADKDLANIFSKNPGVLRVELEDIQTKLSYLESKKFTKEDIARIVSKAPLMLTRTVKQLDTQLGYLQREFRLTGNEIRLTVSRCPKLATWAVVGIKQVKFSLEEFMGFSKPELKQLFLALPKIYLSSENSLVQRFDYVHNKIGLSHEQILQWPNILRCRLHLLKQRHEFLKHLGRNQYDVSRENYISPKALVAGKDVEFCNVVAKSTVKHYNEFLKTL